MKPAILHPLSSILALFLAVASAGAYPLVMFNPTNGAVLNATNLSLTPAQTNQVNALAVAAGSAAFAGAAVTTNFTTAILSGAGYAAANGVYPDFDWADILAANCVNASNATIVLFGGGATNGGLTTNVLEIDNLLLNQAVYYATNFSTNAAQIVWFAATNSYNPVPTARLFTITNLVANLGPLAVAQVATQITAAVTAAVTAGGTNFEAALAGLNHPPTFGGDGLTNLAAVGSQVWGIQKPYLVIYLAPYALNTEAQLTNTVNMLVKMPQFSAITNSGMGVMMVMDVNGSNRRDTNGVLQWSYYLYPHGPNWMTAYLAANGIEATFGIYGESVVHLPAGANGGVCPAIGGSPFNVSFYTGTNGLAYGTNYSDCMTPEQIPADLATISGWGFTNVEVNDLGSGDNEWENQIQLQREVSAACIKLRSASTGRCMGYSAYDTSPGAAYGRCMGNFTRNLHNAIAFDQPQGDAEKFLRGWMIDFAGCDSASHGAYQLNNIFSSPQPQMTVSALISGFCCPGWFPGEINQYTNEPVITLATNPLWQAIELDPGQAFPTLVTDLGTNGSVWTKPMTGGRFAVGIFNGGNAGSNITVSLPAVALSGVNYAVSNVWTAGYLGTFGSSLVASNLTARGQSNCAALWLCTPLAAATVTTNGLATTNFVNAAVAAATNGATFFGSNVVTSATASGPVTLGTVTNAAGLALTIAVTNPIVIGNVVQTNLVIPLGNCLNYQNATTSGGDNQSRPAWVICGNSEKKIFVPVPLYVNACNLTIAYSFTTGGGTLTFTNNIFSQYATLAGNGNGLTNATVTLTGNALNYQTYPGLTFPDVGATNGLKWFVLDFPTPTNTANNAFVDQIRLNVYQLNSVLTNL